MKRSVWKYFKVRSAAAQPGGYDSGSKKSGKSGKSKKSGSKKSGKSGKSKKSGSGKGGYYTRRNLLVREPEANANEAVRRWLGLAPRDAEPSDYGYYSPPPKSGSGKSGKSGKSKKAANLASPRRAASPARATCVDWPFAAPTLTLVTTAILLLKEARRAANLERPRNQANLTGRRSQANLESQARVVTMFVEV